jgi:hypothetical protein
MSEKCTQPSKAVPFQCRCSNAKAAVGFQPLRLATPFKDQLRTLALNATYQYITDDYDMPEALPPLILLLAHLRDGYDAIMCASRSLPRPSFCRLPTVSTTLSLHTPARLGRS